MCDSHRVGMLHKPCAAVELALQAAGRELDLASAATRQMAKSVWVGGGHTPLINFVATKTNWFGADRTKPS